MITVIEVPLGIFGQRRPMQYDAMIQVLVVPTGRGAMGPIGAEAARHGCLFFTINHHSWPTKITLAKRLASPQKYVARRYLG